MSTRPQLTPGTAHDSTRYEVEVHHIATGLWYLNLSSDDLQQCRNRVAILKQHQPNEFDDARVVVVSETRRIAE